MHPTVEQFTERVVKKHGMNTPETRVLIVGSYDVNGSVRPYFNKAQVIGIDIAEGPGVDHVINAHDLAKPEVVLTLLPYMNGSGFDVIACTEMLEHDDQFWDTLRGIGEYLNPGGWLILTARGVRRNGEGMPEHAYPDDYFRFMPNVVPKLLRLAQCDTIEDVQDTWHPGFLALGKRV